VVNEAGDQPWAGNAVNVDMGTGDPFHEGLLTCHSDLRRKAAQNDADCGGVNKKRMIIIIRPIHNKKSGSRITPEINPATKYRRV